MNVFVGLRYAVWADAGGAGDDALSLEEVAARVNALVASGLMK